MDCEVIANTDNINKLIAESAIVISAPSTLAFKPIQLGIPTVLIDGCGAIGHFKDYGGLVQLKKEHIFNNLQKQIDNDIHTSFIKNTIAGGNSFTSTNIYIKRLQEII